MIDWFIDKSLQDTKESNGNVGSFIISLMNDKISGRALQYISPLLSPATKWQGDIGIGADVRPVRPSVLPSFRPSVTFRFRSRTQKP